jgi:hypothetical protein
MMDFDELCRDFDQRRPHTIPVNAVALCSIPWDNGNQSSNDLLTRWLIQRKIEYLQDFSGTVWFLWGGKWTCSNVKYDCKTNIAHFSRCIF